MNISDNILRYHLRNVRFLGGTACGGKTTMARRLAERYGFTLYSEGTNHGEHKRIASAQFQPAMSREFSSWNEYFSRPYREYAQWLTDALKEDVEMALMDIISGSCDQEVIADIHMPLEIASRLIEHNQIVFLVAGPELVVSDYFNRADHRQILDCIAGLPDPSEARTNVEKALVYGTDRFLQELYQTDWYCIVRDGNSTVEGTFHLIEKHFGLA
jgi:hypothetical protein